MALIRKPLYPERKPKMPSALKREFNGRLPKHLLSEIVCGGQMYTWAAFSFDVMYADAKKDGIKLRNIGDYRPYERIVRLFLDRFSLVDEGRVPQIKRKYEGKTWYLKKGKAPCATPDPKGKKGSNHGWGLSIDLDVKAAKTFKWMVDNAPKYGFFMENGDPKAPSYEAWHWTWAMGDALTPYVQKVAEALAGAKP